jgi:hypothetical protein
LIYTSARGFLWQYHSRSVEAVHHRALKAVRAVPLWETTQKDVLRGGRNVPLCTKAERNWRPGWCLSIFRIYEYYSAWFE